MRDDVLPRTGEAVALLEAASALEDLDPEMEWVLEEMTRARSLLRRQEWPDAVQR